MVLHVEEGEPLELTAAARRPESPRRFAVAATGFVLAAAAVVTLCSRSADAPPDVLSVGRYSSQETKRAAHARLRQLGRTQMLTPTPLKNRAVAEADSAKAEQFAERIAALPTLLGGSASAEPSSVLNSDAGRSPVKTPNADARASLQVKCSLHSSDLRVLLSSPPSYQGALGDLIVKGNALPAEQNDKDNEMLKGQLARLHLSHPARTERGASGVPLSHLPGKFSQTGCASCMVEEPHGTALQLQFFADLDRVTAGVDMKPWMIKLFRDGTQSQQVFLLRWRIRGI